MSGFTKLVPELVQSSIWNESAEVRCVWITMLAVKDKDGNVRGNPLSLARLANVSIEAVNAALEKFQAPDPHSNTPDHQGRRIAAVSGGWHVLNHALYRGKDYREHEAERKRQERAQKKDAGESVRTRPDMSGQVPDASASVSSSASSSGTEEGGCKGETEHPPRHRPCDILETDEIIGWVQCTKPRNDAERKACRHDEADGWLFPVTARKAAEWKEAYPAVLIDETLKEIRQRIRDTGKYRKTPPGVYAMVGGWMAREQNKA